MKLWKKLQPTKNNFIRLSSLNRRVVPFFLYTLTFFFFYNTPNTIFFTRYLLDYQYLNKKGIGMQKKNLLIVMCLVLLNVLQAEDVHSNMVKPILTAELQGSEGNRVKEIDGLMKKIGTIGYSTVAANKNIQVHYYNKFQEKNVEMLSFFGMVNKEKVRALLLANPDFGAYAPFNFLVYKTLDTQNDNNTWYGHLAPDTMLDIIGSKDEGNRKAFKEMVGSLDMLVNKEMIPSLSKKFEHTKPLPALGLTKLVKKFEKTDDLETFIEDFISDHDGRFSKHDFIIAGFIDYKFEYEDMDLEFDKYDAYWVSLLCHFKFSNSIFNRGIPEAGMFAPCSVYFYIPKGTNELHVGYASVDNWINALNFRDQRRIDYMKAIDAEVVQTFEEMGFVKEDQEARKTVKQVIKEDNKNTEIEALKAELAKVKAELAALKEAKNKESATPATVQPIKEKPETKAVLPNKIFKTAKVILGADIPKQMSAYYAAQPQRLDVLKEHLKKNGFEILSQSEPIKGHVVLTITNSQLQATNTFLATLNVHLNGTDEIRVQNPNYFGAAYLGEGYTYGQFDETIKSLIAALGDLYRVEDTYASKELASYQFMMGMPQYNDFIEVSEGTELLAKVKTSNKYVAYTLTLPNGAVLVGHKLKKRTNKFLHKIVAERNTNILPYQSLIKNNKAVILDPKYYLALSLPLLTMSNFMKIASAPAEIEKDIKRTYK